MGNSKKRSFLRTVLLMVNLLFIFGLLLSYAAAYISPARYWIFPFFGIAYPVFLLVNIFFVVFWLILLKKHFLFSLIAILLGLNFLLAVLPFRFSSNLTVPPGSFKVMTFNVHSLYGKTNRNYNPLTPSMVMDFIASEKPDILCIQELFAVGKDYKEVLENVKKKISIENCYFHNYINIPDISKINAIAIFSRFPIVRTGSITFRGKNIMAIFTDIVQNGDTIRVYNVHLESFRFGNEDYSFYSHLTEPTGNNLKIKEGSLKIFGKLKKAFVSRAEQVELLKKDVSKSPYPVILCGDFNDTPSSYTYHQMKAGLTDAFREAGHGIFGNTFAGNFPSFRIDYVMFDENFAAFDYRKYNTDFSDHYPVSVYLKKIK
ncbi:MAG: endonuclease/exonuclease/phosphatase family protein [Bacteroidetes bacterium]|nr:endonuclease/exonuclease/phosphatase family protein [Bacteroidota bacterium]